MKNDHEQNRDESLGHRRPDAKEVQRRAYQLYLDRGRKPGRELDDWIKAERELNEREQSTTVRN
jgi:DUF2934 family protein